MKQARDILSQLPGPDYFWVYDQLKILDKRNFFFEGIGVKRYKGPLADLTRAKALGSGELSRARSQDCQSTYAIHLLELGRLAPG